MTDNRNNLETGKMLKKLKEREAKQKTRKTYQFPVWSDSKRGVPNPLLHSELFTARNKTGNEFLKNKILFSQADIKIKYWGAVLTQAHLDVFEAVMHFIRAQKHDTEVNFTANEMLRLIGRKTGGHDRERLHLALMEMVATNLSIRNKDGTVYFGSLIPEGSYEEEEGRYKLSITRSLILFFERGFTLMNLDQRQQLARSPLAQFLHGWVLSHANNPYPVTVEYLKNLSGSETKELKKFRQNLKTALNRLVDIDVLKDWFIDSTDKVHTHKLTPPKLID